ncbi:hypothetical protein RI367_003635 [Sorochytrium milnesiophthora]
MMRYGVAAQAAVVAIVLASAWIIGAIPAGNETYTPATVCDTQTLKAVDMPWPPGLLLSSTVTLSLFAQSALATCNSSYVMQPCDFVQIMGGSAACPYCLYYYPHVMEAMARYNMTSPQRIAAFLAQIRHETAGLSTLWQHLDNGAGGIHMIPTNFPAAIAGIPQLNNTFNVQYAGSLPLGNIASDTTLQYRVALFIMRAEHAFLTAGWWFASGAQQILGSNGCGDLRQDADSGIGEPNTPSGYYKISLCIFGSLADQGLPQRVSYYQSAVQAVNSAQAQSAGPQPGAGANNAALNIVLGIISVAVFVASVAYYYHSRGATVPLLGPLYHYLQRRWRNRHIESRAKTAQSLKALASISKSTNLATPTAADAEQEIHVMKSVKGVDGGSRDKRGSAAEPLTSAIKGKASLK